MSLIGYLFLAIIVYFFYTVFVKVIWPVYKTTRRLRRQFKNMSDQHQAQQPPPPTASASWEKKKKRRKESGEYIEFEEVE